MNEPDIISSLEQCFFPYATRRIEELAPEGHGLAHYTSLDVAEKIIKNSELWLTSSQFMNDFSEIYYGDACVYSCFSDPEAYGYAKIICDRIRHGLLDSLHDWFRSGEDLRTGGTYLTSFSSHRERRNREHLYGRLSMWRAYGGPVNVALVFKNEILNVRNAGLKLVISPVRYSEIKEFKKDFYELFQSVEKNIAFCQSLGPEIVEINLRAALHFAALSTKHPGFAEEEEWRVIYSPEVFGEPEVPELIREDEVTLGNETRKIFKIRLSKLGGSEPIDLSLVTWLQRILIKPVRDTESVSLQLTRSLYEAGFSEVDDKIRISGIPFRR